MTRSMLLLLALVATVLMVATSASAAPSTTGVVMTSGGTLFCSFLPPEFGGAGECDLGIAGVSGIGGPGGLCNVSRFDITTGPRAGGPFYCVAQVLDPDAVPVPTVVINVHCLVTVGFTLYAESFHGTIVVRDGIATGYCPSPNAP
jgi:hypothetical protein